MLDSMYFGEFDGYSIKVGGRFGKEIPVQNANAPCPIMVAVNSTNMSFENILTFYKQTRARLPHFAQDNAEIYLIPTIVLKVGGTSINSSLGFVGVVASERYSCKLDFSVVVSGISPNAPELVSASETISFSINLVSGGSTQAKVIENITIDYKKAGDNDDYLIGTDYYGLVGDNHVPIKPSEDTDGYAKLEEINWVDENGEVYDGDIYTAVKKEGEIATSTAGSMYLKQTGYSSYTGCFALLGKKVISYSGNVDEQPSVDHFYVLNSRGQLETPQDMNNAGYSIEEGVNLYANFAALLGFNQNIVKEILSNVQRILYAKTGYVSPYINVGSLNYMLVESNDFDDNDFGWDAMYRTYYKNNVDQAVYPNNADLINDMFRYNMAMLNNKQNEEFAPTLRNPDYISIHTFRHEHGVVDFYFPLNFLFICQGISSGFPHYACASQSLVVKFTFLNPKAFINTCIVVKPTAVDPLDTTM